MLKALNDPLFPGGGDGNPQLHTSALRRFHTQEFPVQGNPSVLGCFQSCGDRKFSEAAGRSAIGRANASSFVALCVLTALLHARQKLCCTPQKYREGTCRLLFCVPFYIAHCAEGLFGRHVQVVINCAGEEKRTAEADGQENQDWYATTQ